MCGPNAAFYFVNEEKLDLPHGAKDPWPIAGPHDLRALDLEADGIFGGYPPTQGDPVGARLLHDPAVIEVRRVTFITPRRPTIFVAPFHKKSKVPRRRGHREQVRKKGGEGGYSFRAILSLIGPRAAHPFRG